MFKRKIRHDIQSQHHVTDFHYVWIMLMVINVLNHIMTNLSYLDIMQLIVVFWLACARQQFQKNR